MQVRRQVVLWIGRWAMLTLFRSTNRPRRTADRKQERMTHKKKRIWTRLLALLVTVMVAVGGLPLTVLAAEPDSELITTVPHTQQDSSQANYFTFAPGKWEGGNETHIW